MSPEKVERIYDNRLTYTGFFPGVEEPIKKLYEEMYPGHHFSYDRFHWRWKENPVLQDQIVNVWDGDLLVAHETTNSAAYYRNGVREIWGLSGTTIARDDYPGMKVLLTAKRRNLCPEIQYCIGFPNANMYRIAKNLNENEDLGGIPYYVFTPRPCESDGHITRIESFSDDCISLDNALSKISSFYVEHSREYLNWRFAKKPDSGYEIYEYRREGVLLGYIVINTYASDGALQGQIIDVVAAEDEVFSRLIAYANNVFFDKGCVMSKMWMTMSHYEPLLFDLGAVKSEAKFRLISTLKGLNLGESYITMATSDVF